MIVFTRNYPRNECVERAAPKFRRTQLELANPGSVIRVVKSYWIFTVSLGSASVVKACIYLFDAGMGSMSMRLIFAA